MRDWFPVLALSLCLGCSSAQLRPISSEIIPSTQFKRLDPICNGAYQSTWTNWDPDPELIKRMEWRLYTLRRIPTTGG